MFFQTADSAWGLSVWIQVHHSHSDWTTWCWEEGKDIHLIVEHEFCLQILNQKLPPLFSGLREASLKDFIKMPFFHNFIWIVVSNGLKIFARGQLFFEVYCLQELATHPVNVQRLRQNLDVHMSSTPSKKKSSRNIDISYFHVTIWGQNKGSSFENWDLIILEVETLSISVMEIILYSQVIDYIQCKIPSNYLQISSKDQMFFI